MSQAERVSWGEVRRTLDEHFGFRRFRKGQARAVQSAIEGRDTLVVMPTGSGKSLCFQLPALALPGTTIVVSPLIALMKDQTDVLRERGIAVVACNSTQTAAERRDAEAAIEAGRIEFVYTTPERLADPSFRALLKSIHVDLFVVDEAHCVCQWGHDFRPEYLALGAVIEELGHPQVLALTATATPDVVDDVLRQLRIPDAEVVHTGFDRPNLYLAVTPVADETEKRTALVRLLSESEGTGVVYTATVKAVGELTTFLQAQGFNVASYHGRMKIKERIENQNRFMDNELKAMIATNAFGLGIDKPDIRFVIHHQLPGTLESYYQEFGRAGRDGQPACCTALYNPSDRALQRFFQAGRYPSGTDLINVHHALKRLAEGPEPPNVAELQAISPVGKTRTRVVLALFDAKGVTRQDDEGRIILVEPDLTTDDLERVGRSYQDRAEDDRLKGQRVVEYAESRSCRWATLLNYFEADDQELASCGHCDRCSAELPTTLPTEQGAA
jgi:ATP-dependent DNA helicase RecQ